MVECDEWGVYPFISTPFNEDETVDHEGIEWVIEAQVNQEIHGVVLFGIAAESHKLGDDERH